MTTTKKTDRELLIWIHERLIHVHGESECADHMRRIRAIICGYEAEKTTPNTGGENMSDTIKKIGLWKA